MTNQEIIHLFASADLKYNKRLKKGKIKCNNLTISLENNIALLYSYNTIIAKRYFKNNLFIVSQRNFSLTTSRHINDLYSALYNYDVIFVYDVNYENIKNINTLYQDIVNLILKQFRARISDYSHTIKMSIDNLVKFCTFIKIDKRSKLYKKIKFLSENKNNMEELYKKVLELTQKDIEKLKTKKVKAETEKQKTLKFLNNFLELKKFLQSRCDAFLNGDEIKFKKLEKKYHSYLNFSSKNSYLLLNYKDCLKIKNNKIITSQGVKIPIKTAIQLYHQVKNKKFKKGDYVLDWIFKKYTNEGIIVGCHNIPYYAIEKVYQKIKNFTNEI